MSIDSPLEPADAGTPCGRRPSQVDESLALLRDDISEFFMPRMSVIREFLGDDEIGKSRQWAYEAGLLDVDACVVERTRRVTSASQLCPCARVRLREQVAPGLVGFERGPGVHHTLLDVGELGFGRLQRVFVGSLLAGHFYRRNRANALVDEVLQPLELLLARARFVLEWSRRRRPDLRLGARELGGQLRLEDADALVAAPSSCLSPRENGGGFTDLFTRSIRIVRVESKDDAKNVQPGFSARSCGWRLGTGVRVPPMRQPVEPALLITREPSQHVQPWIRDLDEGSDQGLSGFVKRQRAKRSAETLERVTGGFLAKLVEVIPLFCAIVGAGAVRSAYYPGVPAETNLCPNTTAGKLVSQETCVFGVRE